MIFRSSRLFVIKFLGLWGTNSALVKDTKESEPTRLNHDPDKTKFDPSNDITSKTYQSAINASTKKVVSEILEKGIPGLTISVSKKGQVVWETGFGFCDVENQLPCEPDAHMRIASISKSIFSASLVGPLIEEKKIDLKSSIHKYLSYDEFPKQKFQNKEYDLNIEQLLSHTSGIRNYTGDCKPEERPVRPIGSEGSKKLYQTEGQYKKEEFYQRKTFRNVLDALEMFKDGPLEKEPGQYNYTTHGYTLLSAVIQKVYQLEDKSKGQQIEDLWIKTLHNKWNMKNTYLDYDELLISKRARYYSRSSLNGGLFNAPYTDLSNKWAGGGVISTTNDLVKFANELITSYKGHPKAILKRETLDILWKKITGNYCLGFNVIEPQGNKTGSLAVYHTGSAVGASSVLVIYPEEEIAVAILSNIDSCNLQPLGFFIAEQFKT